MSCIIAPHRSRTRGTAIAAAALLALALLLFARSGMAQSGSVSLPAAAPGSSPAVISVSPASAPNDVNTTVTITGTGFISTPQVLLNDAALASVTFVSETVLSATIPWGLDPGVYELAVVNPDEGRAELAKAFTVTQGIGVWASGGPYGGEMLEVALDPDDPSRVYAMAVSTGWFVSPDAAATWQPMHFDGGLGAALAFDSQDAKTIYLGASGPFYRSRDGGASWSLVALPYEAPGFPSPVVPAGAAPGVVFLGVSAGPSGGNPQWSESELYRSDDYGDTWISSSTGMTDTEVMTLVAYPDDPQHLVAGTRLGNVFVSGDGGASWQWAAHPTTTITRLYVDPVAPHAVWAIPANCCQPPPGPYIYKSLDAGLTQWEPVTVAAWNQNQWVTSLAFTVDDGQSKIWAGVRNEVDGIFTSEDGGETWTAQAGSPPEVLSMAIDPTNPLVITLGTKCGPGVQERVCGVYRTTDGGQTWAQRIDGLAGLLTESLAASPFDVDKVYAYTYRGVLRSADGGHTWQETEIYKKGGFPWVGSRLAADPFEPGRLYLGDSSTYGPASSPEVQIGDESGANWQSHLLPKIAGQDDWCGDVFAVGVHPARDGQVFAGATLYPPELCWPNHVVRPAGRIYRSGDHGATWTGVTISQPISGVVRFAFDAVDPDLMYAGTDGSGLVMSTDGGQNWHAPAAWPPKPDGCRSISSITTHPTTGSAVYVGCSDPEPGKGGSFRSADAGATWQPMPAPETGAMVWQRGIQPALYVGSPWSNRGLSRSLDNGVTWSSVPGLPTGAGIFDLAVGHEEQRDVLYVATAGGWAAGAGQGRALSAGGSGALMSGGIYRRLSRETHVLLPVLQK